MVAETLGQAYPEVVKQLPRITTILEHEEHAFYDTQKEVSRCVGWIITSLYLFTKIMKLQVVVSCNWNCAFIINYLVKHQQ